MHRHRQLHLWITEHDYAELQALAVERRETLSSLIRRLIKSHRADRAPDAARVSTGWPAARALPDRTSVESEVSAWSLWL